MRIMWSANTLLFFLCFSSPSFACGPAEQTWTWAGVNQYRPEQCSCEELRTALNEEQVIYLGTYWKGIYLFSSPEECRQSFSQNPRKGEVRDKKGRECKIGFSCLGKHMASLKTNK
ncbi:MAG: hypothetical protein H6624_03955 [Bdellovibrionaceae bacterium]|nr:hypothetical protein [Bdellovibrionales bacterium]MCB9083468.1 hypothetical protein [Pseudobdellovibrionaceae bacterium]